MWRQNCKCTISDVIVILGQSGNGDRRHEAEAELGRLMKMLVKMQFTFATLVLGSVVLLLFRVD